MKGWACGHTGRKWQLWSLQLWSFYSGVSHKWQTLSYCSELLLDLPAHINIWLCSTFNKFGSEKLSSIKFWSAEIRLNGFCYLKLNLTNTVMWRVTWRVTDIITCFEIEPRTPKSSTVNKGQERRRLEIHWKIKRGQLDT